MARDSGRTEGKGKDRDKTPARDMGRGKRVVQSAVTDAAEARVAAAMGPSAMGPIAARPALPESREELTELWNEARRRRQSAPLGSEEFVQASEDVARIEVAIAAAERAMTPPRV
jgi:hypothetical protein